MLKGDYSENYGRSFSNEKNNTTNYYNHKYISNNNGINNNNDIDYISLYFYLNKKNYENHSYIIITSLNELFSKVVQKLLNAVPFLSKDNILGYISLDNEKIKLELNKTVEDNNLKDGSKINVQIK